MKKFVSKVLSMHPGLKYVNGVFYWGGVDHVMSGFMCEFLRSEVRLWHYLLPIYDRYDGFHLNYSIKVASPDDLMPRTTDILMTAKFCEIMCRHADEADEYKSLYKFVSLLGEMAGGVDGGPLQEVSPQVRYGYACTLALIGNVELAISQLKLALKILGKFFIKNGAMDFISVILEASGDRKVFRSLEGILGEGDYKLLSDIDILYSMLVRDPLQVKNFLMEREAANKKLLFPG